MGVKERVHFDQRSLEAGDGVLVVAQDSALVKESKLADEKGAWLSFDERPEIAEHIEIQRGVKLPGVIIGPAKRLVLLQLGVWEQGRVVENELEILFHRQRY